MDHRALVATLTPAQRAHLTQTSDRAGLRHLALHAGAIAGLGVLIGLRVPFWPLLMLPQGVLIVFLFTLLHETTHRTPFRSRWLNDGVARLCGWLIALPPEWFRCFHFAHHRFTQDPENDPELAVPKPVTPAGYALHVSGLPAWASAARVLLRNASGRCADSFVPARALPRIRHEAQGMLAGYALVAGMSLWAGSSLALTVWAVPALLGQPVLRLYLLAEHGRCPFVANMLENTRTTYTSRLVRALAWNMPFHAEHHAWPGVPFHRLPEFNRLARNHLRVTEQGYGAFTAGYIAGLR
ncbi:fatty acid desaturase [Paroceanicella profunda]|uniref:Fatty acid desaturase n=1 Tax=Paroceanicella profunda TaxID=2579971 RepID=A0A5B8FHC3_9RHOB|nr:fatty acid desaturase family protein [Paroceanicella profunda]QDL91838.1 fatty acid desaturase [Paroceanicella profunda]